MGSYLCSQLSERGYEVIICDYLSRGNPNATAVLQIPYQSLDKEFLSQFDTVLWFAGHSSVQQSISEPIKALENNCLDLFALAKKLKVSTKFIYASSASLYSSEEIDPALPSDEKSLLNIPNQNAYDMSKFAFDYLSQNFLSNSYAIRMGTVSGFSPNIRTDLIFNAMSLSAALSGRVQLSNATSFRTILFLDDLWLLIDRLLTAQVNPGIINAGSYSSSIGELASKIAECWKADIIDQGIKTTYSFVLDTSLMRNIVGEKAPEKSIAQRSQDFISQYTSRLTQSNGS